MADGLHLRARNDNLVAALDHRKSAGSAAAALAAPTTSRDVEEEDASTVLHALGRSSASATAPFDGTASSAAAQRAAEDESKHEVIALLQQPNGSSSLCMNWANWNAQKAAVEDGAPTLVVSFLGDTEVGKSHTIRELMNPGEDRPFVQRGRDQNASTTFNVNLYCCRSLVRDAVVHLLDFEGENGSDNPLLAKARGALAGKGGAGPVAASSTTLFGLPSVSALSSLASVMTGGGAPSGAPPPALCSRAEAVREHFPRLSYTTSDVVALVGTDPFFSTRYLERAVDFAKRSNAGVCDVDLPVLLLISNRRDGDRCILDIKESTAQFMDAMGDSFRVLDQYFSALLCVYLPNKRNTTVGEDGAVYDGEALYALQMRKLRTVLAALMKARLASRYGGADGGGGGGGSRLITCRQGLWFDLVPRVVRELNAGRPVHVTRLVDEAWSSAMAHVSSQSEAVGDILKSLVAALRPHPSLSAHARDATADFQARFAAFHALTLDLAVRVAAARLRHVDPNLRFPVRMRAYARVQLEATLSLLEGVTPCKAVYGQGHHAAANGETGTPVDRPHEPVTCLQEHRVHSKGHRSGRRVRGGGRTLWAKFTSLVAYSPAWAGRYEATPVGAPDMEAMLGDVLALVSAPPEDFMLALGMARAAHSGGYVDIQLAPMLPAHATEGSSSLHAGGDGLVRLSSSPSSTAPLQPCMPYCIGCTRKVVTGVVEEGGGGSGAPVAEDAPAPATAAWFTSMMEAVGLSGGKDDDVSSGARGAGRNAAAQARGRPIAPGGDGPVQDVVLGLCPGCWDACIAANTVERARQAHARTTMADVE